MSIQCKVSANANFLTSPIYLDIYDPTLKIIGLNMLIKCPKLERQTVASIEYVGLAETRKIKGYHDEPLKGDRKGQRSIRLNQAYRAIYVEEAGQVHLVIILEVNKHEY